MHREAHVTIYEDLIGKLGREFGVLAQSDTHQLTVVAHNGDVAVGDLFLMPSRRGGKERFYVFRTSEYANVLNRAIDIGDVARNKLTMPDSYRSEDLIEEQLIELKGVVMGYAELEGDKWAFRRPRRLPEHLTNVYRIDPESSASAEVIQLLFESQLGSKGLYIGDLLAGEQALKGVKVFLPAYALSHHIGAFGRTGVGKSNLMMVLISAVLDYNRQRWVTKDYSEPAASLFAIDPHDEFRRWHANRTGGADGMAGMVGAMSEDEKSALVEPFYYLTARTITDEDMARQIVLSRADVLPQDLVSITEFSEQQTAFANQQFGNWGHEWVTRVLNNELRREDDDGDGPDYMEGTVGAVQRRLGFLATGSTRVFSAYFPEKGYDYESLLPEIICALERGRILVVDTTLMSELEQFLVTTIVARTLFTLRRALRSVETVAELPTAIRAAFGNELAEDGSEISPGQRALVEVLLDKMESGELPYIHDGKPIAQDKLPYVNVVVEEAPSILNPARMRFGSVFRDISRQGRKFGIGLTVVSQQVTEIDSGVLTQLNTELNMALGNEQERREAVRNASADLAGFEKELQVMGKGQVIVTASYRDVPLPIQVPDFDVLSKRDSE
jgi:DNA helicase HerA-like ATPase